MNLFKIVISQGKMLIFVYDRELLVTFYETSL